ncbi:MAG TPA: sugar ABC transporter ATP-binding protein [Solirubrobacterales bacterium]|jgi:ribose transport system ATP-binding protein
MTAPVLEITGLSKKFAGQYALEDVALDVAAGEVHGLLGENGSGKSTLIKILAGFHAPEPGAAVKVNGSAVELPIKPDQFRALGMSFVHQDLALIPSLSVTENLSVGELSTQGRKLVSWRHERARAATVLERYGVEIDPAARVGDLRSTDRALLAIVRAMEGLGRREGEPALLVLDEPTVFLPREGVLRLFELVRTVCESGSGVLFVSHDLDEVKHITDRVTVLRDGRAIDTRPTAETSENELVELIIGRKLVIDTAAAAKGVETEVGLEVEKVSGGLVRDVSFTVRRGEILGLAGLAGSGFEDILYLLFGARQARAGTMRLEGRSVDLTAMTPAVAVEQGLALVPADRARDGSAPTLTVGDNVMLQTMDRYQRSMRLNRRAMAGKAGTVLEEFDVRPSDPRAVYRSLSGGNQQKALLAKWLQSQPRLLLLHEPVQGVDIGARHQIFQLMHAAAAEGMMVVCASSDYEELAITCDRVLVVGRGRITEELSGDDVNKHRIAERCYQSTSLAA